MSNWDWYAEQTKQNEINRRRYEAWWWGDSVQASSSPDALAAAPPMQNTLAQTGLKLFNWDDLRNIDQYPSLAIMGKPGTGKTVLGEWLLHQLQGESRVITTKRKSSQWRGLPVFGVPRNFEAIASALGDLVDELSDRIANLDFDHVALNVAIDELPAIALNIPNLKDYLQPLILEARETKIRPIFLMHGDEVELLGIQGKGSLRKSITYIRLGNFALEYAQELINKKRADVSLINWLEQQSRPCLVDIYPAIIPDLANWKPIGISQGSNEVPAGSSSGSNQGSSSRTYEVPMVPEIEPDKHADPLAEVLEPETIGKIIMLRRGNLAQDEIIKAVFGVAKGGSKKYLSARNHYLQIIGNAGLN